MPSKNFAEKLKQLMNEKDLNSYQLSQRTSIDEKIIQGLLNGDTSCDVDNLLKLANYFETSTDYLLNRVNARYESFAVRTMPWH